MRSLDFFGYDNAEYVRLLQEQSIAIEKKGIVRINKEGIAGTVYLYDLKNILQIRVSDIHVSNSLEVNYHSQKNMIGCHFFCDTKLENPILINDEPINQDILCIKNMDRISYSIHKDSSAKVIFLGISKEFYSDPKNIENTIIEKLFSAEELLIFQMETPIIKMLCEKIIEIQQSEDLRFHMSIGLAIELMAHFFQQLENRENNIPTSILKDHNLRQVVKARTLLLSDLQNPPIIEDLAFKVSSSSSQLRKYFKELFGQSIYQYYKSYKLEVSYRWLQNGTTTIKEAALKTGYSSNSKFSAEFKKYHGVLPKEVVTL